MALLIDRDRTLARRVARAAPFVAGLVLVAVSCDGSGETGNLDMDLYDGTAPIDCPDPDAEDCFDALTGALVPPEHVTGFAFMSTEPSQFEDGLFLYFDLVRADGALVRGELDVPRKRRDIDAHEPDITYVEHVDGVEVFRADEITGVVLVPDETTGERCDCMDGRFELALHDFGPDELPDTEDDAHRRLSRAIFGWGPRRCLQPTRIALPDEPGHVDVRTTVECPPALPSTSTTTTTTTPRRDPRLRDTVDVGCSNSTTTTSTSDDGCGGSSSSSSSGGGCEGDSSSGSGSCSGDGSGGSGGGCDDGGGSSSSSGSSCEGDSSSGSGGCEGDSSSGSGSCSGDSSGGSGSCSGDGGGSSSCGSGGGSDSCADGASVAGPPHPRHHIPRIPRRLPRGPLQMLGFLTLALAFTRRR